MHRATDPGWKDLVERWKQTQHDLRAKLIVEPLDPLPKIVAGCDIAFSKDGKTVLAAAVVYDRVDQKVLEVARATRPVDVPYIPTFLSFREAPTLLLAIAKLKTKVGAILFDGQGIAHPRRCGLATHMGITLDIPSVGVAKSRLIGTYDEPGASAGSASPLYDDVSLPPKPRRSAGGNSKSGEPRRREGTKVQEGRNGSAGGASNVKTVREQIGAVLRTRDNGRPLFISVGHRIDIDSALKMVMACRTKYRLPEPTRLADAEVAKMKRET